MSAREERLEGYGWTIRKSLRAVGGSSTEAPEGMVEETILAFVSQDGTHRVIVGLDDENRRALANGLTHGIIVA